jgi:hypothetical protein
VRSFLRVLLMLCASGNLLDDICQDTAVRSGFAIITLVSGNIAGLIATETLKNSTSSGVHHAIVAPSPMITTASILVSVGPLSERTTAIAITNPSLGSGGVNLVLTDAIGAVVLNTTINLGPHGHFSRFVNELFAAEPAEFSTPLLLTISSEIPVAILALNCRAGDCASIPLTSLSSPTPIPTQLPPAPANVSSFGLGVPLPSLFFPPVAPLPAVGSSPQPTASSIGGNGSLVFPEVVSGGEWSTEFAIGNTSATTQSVRIDFFESGVNTASLTDIVIPSRGVFFLPDVQAPIQ